jgi:hypothetical protein
VDWFDEPHDLKRIRVDLALGLGLGPEDARALLEWHDALRDKVERLEIQALLDQLDDDDEDDDEDKATSPPDAEGGTSHEDYRSGQRAGGDGGR